MKTITQKQKKVLDFIKKYRKEFNQSPTIREIKEEIKVKSVRTVTQYLERLEDKGFITRNNNQKRNIVIKVGDGEEKFVDVPVVTSAGCDNLNIFAERNYNEFLKVDRDIVKNKNVVAVKAQGSSMLDAGINSGDFILTEITDKPDNNEIVLAVLGDMAGIKRLNYSKNAIMLNPEPINEHHKPIIIKENNLKICGRVIDVIKDPKNEEIQYIQIDEQKQ